MHRHNNRNVEQASVYIITIKFVQTYSICMRSVHVFNK